MADELVDIYDVAMRHQCTALKSVRTSAAYGTPRFTAGSSGARHPGQRRPGVARSVLRGRPRRLVPRVDPYYKVFILAQRLLRG